MFKNLLKMFITLIKYQVLKGSVHPKQYFLTNIRPKSYVACMGFVVF